MTKKKSPAQKPMHRCLSENEIALFMDAAIKQGSVYRNLYTFLLNTGLRVGEAGAITPADVKEDKVMICKTVVRDGSGYVIRNCTKTGEYVAALNADAIAGIRAEMARKDVCADKPIFSLSGGKLINARALLHDIADICKTAGIDVFSPHAFRATFRYKELMRKSPEWQDEFLELAKLFKEASAPQRAEVLAFLDPGRNGGNQS